MEIHKEASEGYLGRIELESRFTILHPVTILLYFVGVFTFPFIYANPAFGLSIFICISLVMVYYNGALAAIKYILMCLPIGLVMFIITPLTSHRGKNILFYLFENPITLEAILYGALSLMLILNMLISFKCFNKLIDSERFLFLFSKLAAKTAFITSMSLRFVSLFKNRGTTIIEVQKTRGIDLGAGKWKDKIRNAGIIFEALLSWSLEEGMSTSEVLKAKAYGGARRTSYRVYRLVATDYAYIIIEGLIITFLIYLRTQGVGAYNAYTDIRIPNFDARSSLGYGLMVAFLLMPLVTDFFVLLKRGVK